jgi:hypothetical protein
MCLNGACSRRAVDASTGTQSLVATLQKAHLDGGGPQPLQLLIGGLGHGSVATITPQSCRADVGNSIALHESELKR